MSEWPMVKLGEIARFVSGGTPDRNNKAYYLGQIPWISGADISDSGHLQIRRRITEEAVEQSATSVVESGTLLLVTRTSIGKIALAPNDLAFSQDITGIFPNDAVILRKYLESFIRSIGAEQLKNRARGVTIKGVNRKDVEELKIPLPPLGEQKRIAEILGGVSKAIQILEHELQLLGEISVLEQQNNLSTQKLSDLVTIRSGTVDPTLSVNRNLPHIAPDSIEKNTGRILQIRSCEEDKVTSGKYHFYKGDVLYSKIRPYLNKVVIAPFEGLCSADMYALRPKEGINSEVLQALLMSKDFLAYAEQWSGRASIPKINRKALLAYNVPKMTDKQVNEVKAKIQSIHKVVELKCRKLSLLQELQKSLVNRAFAGLL
jgi:hypothetical protein